MALLVAALGYIAVVDPSTPGRYPVCPLHALTGIWCPGCGSLRATHALLRGDVVAALGYNALLVLLAPPLAVVVGRAVWRSRTRSRALTGPRPAVLGGLVAVVLAFAVLRNLPVGAALAP